MIESMAWERGARTPQSKVIEIGLVKLRRYIERLVDQPDDASAPETFRKIVLLVINLAHHVCVQHSIPPPSDTVHLFSLLAQRGLLEAEVANRLKELAVLRQKIAFRGYRVTADDLTRWTAPAARADLAAFASMME